MATELTIGSVAALFKAAEAMTAVAATHRLRRPMVHECEGIFSGSECQMPVDGLPLFSVLFCLALNNLLLKR
jgi:carbon starvation protein CstA